MRDKAIFTFSVIDFSGNLIMSNFTLSKKEVELSREPEELILKNLNDAAHEVLEVANFFNISDE